MKTTPGATMGWASAYNLARRLPALLGGEIAVESEFGHGSRFRIRLPATTAIDPLLA